MNRKITFATLYVPTLTDDEGLRHIIPARDKPAYCGATGTQRAPYTWSQRALCKRCCQKYIRLIIEAQENL